MIGVSGSETTRIWRDWMIRVVVLMAALIVTGRSGAAAAQVTYTVFPVATGQPQPVPRHGRISLTVQDSTVDYAVREILRQAGLRAVYMDNVSPPATRITVHLVDVSAMDALAEVFKGTGLVAKMAADGETVVIRTQLHATSSKRLDSGSIVGYVTDSTSGVGIGGATVKIQGTKVSAVTTDSGRFILRAVPSGEQVLTVRIFGYKPATRLVTVVDSQRTTVHIRMVTVATVLSGVVTTAAGLQRKIEVGNDITSLDVDSIMKIAPITSVTDLLETRVPGVTVLHSSGVPGAPSRIRIRGVSSITGNNDPIVIIDGVRVYANQSDARNSNLAPNIAQSTAGKPLASAGGDVSASGFSAPSPIDQINPNSIETIEVFKGPSASALYGSDAANGVIVITTKRGRAGPTHWQLSLGDGVNWLPGSWPTNVYRFGTHPSAYNSLYLGYDDTASVPCRWNDVACALDSLVSFQALNDPRYSVFSHGSNQTASLTVSGGVPTLQYSLTGSGAGAIGNLKLPAIEQQRYEQFYGNIPKYLVRPDNNSYWSASGQLSAQPSPMLHVTLNSSLFANNNQQGSLQGAIAQLEGEYIAHGVVLGGSGSGSLSNDSLSSTPLIQNDVERTTDVQLTANNALSINWQPFSWLPVSVTGGLQTMQRNDVSYIPYGVNNSGPGTTVFDTVGAYGLGHGSSRNQTLSVGTAIPIMPQRLTVAFGGQIYSQSTNDFTIVSNQLAPGVSVPTTFLSCGNTGVGGAAVCTNGPSTQATTSTSTYGLYVQPKIHVLGSFYLNPGFRLDGGNGGASTTNEGLGGLSAFPKIDLSYVVVDQSHPRGILSLFRPRIAFGLAGTQPDPAKKLRLFRNDSIIQITPSTLIPGIILTSLGNTQLRPETSRELEGGFDAEVWHGRLSTTVTAYNKTRFNAIISVPIAPSVVGVFPSQAVNVGEVRNTGTEVTLNLQILQRQALGWFVGVNLSKNADLLVKLAPGFVPDKALGIVAGYPLFGDWARPIVGFADANKNGIIDPNEVQVGDSLGYVGQSNAKYQTNINTGVALLNGHLNINATFAFEGGMTQNNEGAVTSGAVNFIANTPGTPLATEAAIEAAQNISVCGNCGTNIGFYQAVSTFRFNALSISYSLPQSLASWFHSPNAAVQIQGSNLALHSNYRGIDPNVNAFSTVSGGDETTDLGQIPEPRTWWLKLTLGN